MTGAPGSAGVFALASIPTRYALERRAWAEAAGLQPEQSAFPYTEAQVTLRRALGSAKAGDAPQARASIDSLEAITIRLTATGEAYWAEQTAIARQGAQAWLDLAEGRKNHALVNMRKAADREDATEKSAFTPGPLAPARELLGDMLLDVGFPAEALAEYRKFFVRLHRLSAEYKLQFGRLTMSLSGAMTHFLASATH